jgi:hypothetical protein
LAVFFAAAFLAGDFLAVFFTAVFFTATLCSLESNKWNQSNTWIRIPQQTGENLVGTRKR